MDYEYLHIRLTKEQKERFLRLCEAKGLSQVEYFTKWLDAVELFSTTQKSSKKTTKKKSN